VIGLGRGGLKLIHRRLIMKRNGIIIGAAVLFLSACAGFQKRAAGTPVSDILLEPVSADRIALADVKVLRDEKGVYVEGWAVDSNFGRRRHPGHIDMSLFGPDGEVVTTGTFEVKAWMSTLVGRRFRFESRLPEDLKPGSKVRVRFHDTAKVLRSSPHEF